MSYSATIWSGAACLNPLSASSYSGALLVMRTATRAASAGCARNANDRTSVKISGFAEPQRAEGVGPALAVGEPGRGRRAVPDQSLPPCECLKVEASTATWSDG